MSLERQAPDALIGTSGYQGTPTLADVADDPDSPDGAWHVAANNNTSVETHCGFPTPSSGLTDGADLQEFRALVRRTGGSGTGTPTARVELWEAGSLVRAGDEVNVISSTLLSFTWNATEVSSPADVEIKVIGTKTGGSPQVRASVDVGAVEWNAEISAAASIATGESSGAATAAATGRADARATSTVNGVATAAATGRSDARSTATASGTATVAAVGRADATASATASGAATADGTARADAWATASASGTSTANAVGRSVAYSVGVASGAATASAFSGGSTAATGTSSGAATVAATGRADARAVGASSGSSTASATGRSDARSVGLVDGTSSAGATGRSDARATATASGSSTVNGVAAAETAVATGTSSSAATVAAVGRAVSRASATVSAAATAVGIGSSIAVSGGEAFATSTAAGVGSFTVAPAWKPLLVTVEFDGNGDPDIGVAGLTWHHPNGRLWFAQWGSEWITITHVGVVQAARRFVAIGSRKALDYMTPGIAGVLPEQAQELLDDCYAAGARKIVRDSDGATVALMPDVVISGMDPKINALGESYDPDETYQVVE
jgi:hypothetical protein